MKISILGNKESKAFQLTEELIKRTGHTITGLEHSHLAVAPLLTEIVPYYKLKVPIHGTLIFHPSPLPYGRGAASIKHAYKRREPITAAAWFWANDGKVDSGDICEMEIVKIDHSLRPREFYELHVLPAMLRTLERGLSAIEKGIIRRIPQVEDYSSFDYRL
jgi:methionyl-tRNA formyltransferase